MNRYTVRLTYIEVTKTPLRKQHAASFNLYKSPENSTYANNMLRHLTYIEVKNPPLRKQPAAFFSIKYKKKSKKLHLRKQPAASLYESQKKMCA